MEDQKVDMFLMAKSDHFEGSDVMYVRQMLKDMDDSKWPLLQSANLKNPTTILIVSILAGVLGIDRFMIGDTGLGIGKLLTCGGFGIWAIIDYFMIMPATRKKNLLAVQNLLGGEIRTV